MPAHHKRCLTQELQPLVFPNECAATLKLAGNFGELCKYFETTYEKAESDKIAVLPKENPSFWVEEIETFTAIQYERDGGQQLATKVWLRPPYSQCRGALACGSIHTPRFAVHFLE